MNIACAKISFSLSSLTAVSASFRVMSFLNVSKVDGSEFSTPRSTQLSPDFLSLGRASLFPIMSSHLAWTNQVISSCIPVLMISSAMSLARVPAPKLSSVSQMKLLSKFLLQYSISAAILSGDFCLHFPCQCRHCVQKVHSCGHPLDPSIRTYRALSPAIMEKWYFSTLSLTR